MLQAFFNGMSGLLAFAKGLDNVSNNVSNMNTPGYRGSDTFFRSVNGQDGQSFGASIAGNEVRLKAGETRQTGNDSDVAINGAGYFVLRNQQQELFYSRAGQFRVDQEGYLLDSVSRHRVAGIDDAGQLLDINIDASRSLPPVATTRIEMNGSLARSGTTSSVHEINSVSVFDRSGSLQTLDIRLSLQQVPENSWLVEVLDGQGASLKSGTLAFAADGSPQAGFNSLVVMLGSGDSTQEITLDFGSPGSFNLASQVASGASHTLSARVVDGSSVAGLTGFSFDEQGVMQFTYSNGEKRSGSRLALADFPDERVLIAAEQSLYRRPESLSVEYGRAGERQFGRIQGGYIELSNIDLAQEFGDILIIQRGYQASSRVMTVSNELLEQLYNGTRGG